MIAVILAGGSGTRFWPLSRRSRPKQLIHLYGNKSMLEQTIARLGDKVPTGQVLVVCGEHLLEATQQAVPFLQRDNFIVEPTARNTAPAVGLAAAISMRRFGDEVIAVFPSDHYVRDTDGFRAALDDAVEVAEQDFIVTLGITPNRPETGYGYIRYAPLDQITESAHRVAEFVEKPNFETAVGYLQSGDYVWNAGIFVFKPSAMLREFERQCPAMYARLTAIADAWATPQYDEVLRKQFAEIESISVDYAIMENAVDVAVVPTSVGWSDVGHWAAIDAVLDPDDDGNLLDGHVVAIDTRDSAILNTTDGVTAVLGMNGIVVVRTDDAVLVVPRHRTQEVRHIVDALNRQGSGHT